MLQRGVEIWDLWFPNAAAQGISFGRGRMEHADRVWVHAAPPSLRVEVRSDGGERLAFGDQLRLAGEHRPMTCLRREGSNIKRDDRWPTDADIGMPVLLAGGEIGILTSWWNAVDGSEWRWSVEFYNRR